MLQKHIQQALKPLNDFFYDQETFWPDLKRSS